MSEELKVIISAEISKLKKNVEEAKKKVSGFRAEVEKAKKNVDENFKNIGTSVSNGLKAASVSIAAAGTALLALGASTAEYRNEQAKLTTAFEAAGGSAEEAKSTYNDLYRVLGDSGQAVEAASHLAKLTTEEKALSEWTTICQGVYATFGSSLPIEGLTEAANETAKVGTVTGGLADALNWAGISEDAFNEKLAATNTEAEREKLIRETLNGIYNDAATKYEANNAQVLAQNEANAKLNETMAALGEAVAPIVTIFTEFANTALSAVVPHIQSLTQYTPELQAALEKTAEVVGTIMGFLTDNWDIVLTIAGVIGGIAAAIGIYNAVAAIKAAMAAAEVTTVWGLVAAYAAQAAAMIVAIAPYVLIVAAIAAVIAIIVLCIKNWDKIKETVVNVANRIGAKIKEMKDSVVNSISNLVNNMRNKFNAAKEAVLGVFDRIKNGIKEKIESAKNTVKNIIDAIKGFFNFKWSLPKLKMPSIKITGKFSLVPLQVPKFSINWNALGGVFDKPTLFPYGNSLQGIGEDGAEAVVPLEKNTQWLDRIAERLSKSGNKPIYLVVDKRVLGQVSAEGINDITQQTGSIPLVIV